MSIRRAFIRLATTALVCASAIASAGVQATTASAAPNLPPDTPVARQVSTGSTSTLSPSVQYSGSATSGVSAAFHGTGNLADSHGEIKAAPGAVAPSTVIGTDDRTRVTDTTAFPDRAITLIIMTYSDGSTSQCTGFFYSPSVIATAGHCVNTAADGWATSAIVYPGYDAGSAPYGSCNATTFYSVTGWTTSHDWDYDYGAMKLDCSLGNTVGWFGMYWTAFSEQDDPITITGYPGEKTPQFSMWTMSDVVVTDLPYPHLFYDIDTTPGQSGAAVDETDNIADCGSDCAIGIHAYGTGISSDQPDLNSGTRITEAAFDNYQTWRS